MIRDEYDLTGNNATNDCVTGPIECIFGTLDRFVFIESPLSDVPPPKRHRQSMEDRRQCWKDAQRRANARGRR